MSENLKCIAMRYRMLASIVTFFGLNGSEFEPQWGTKFFVSIQPGPEAHSASCMMVTRSFSWG